MKKTATFFVFVCALVTCTECFERKTECLAGDKHKDSLAPEESLYACQAYTQNSCCTRNFTKQLANSPIRKIDGFSWTPCNKTLSPKCEAFMVSIECFYRCSHNTIYWENPAYPSAMLNAPICAGCKDDLTCAKNWLTDFNTTGPGNANTCKNPCQNFSDYYNGGKDLCESMWGSSFVLSSPPVSPRFFSCSLFFARAPLSERLEQATLRMVVISRLITLECKSRLKL